MNESAANSTPHLIHEWTEGSSLRPSPHVIFQHNLSIKPNCMIPREKGTGENIIKVAK